MPKQIRPKEIKIRLSIAEHERLLKLAGNNALAPWLRDLGLGERSLDLSPDSKFDSESSKKMLFQVAAIGNNLNQIARALNMIKLPESEKINHLLTLDQIKKKVDQIVG